MMKTLMHPTTHMSVTPPQHETRRVFRGRNVLGLCLISLGVAIPAVSAGKLVLNPQQHAAAPIRWDLLATEAGVGGALAITGFSLIAASAREEIVVDADTERETISADRVCSACRATNDSAARFCDQCGVRLG